MNRLRSRAKAVNRRNFIVTALGAVVASLGLHASVPKRPLTGYKHTILPPPGKMPLDRSAWRQYVTIDPADRRHAISYWARSDPPKVIPPGYFNPASRG
jgi:hypothetical protein